jgi:hypothetical protein
MKKFSFFPVAIFLSLSVQAQTPQMVWDSIKNATAPVIDPAFVTVYDAAYRQPLADYGWEDGVHLSPDGLNLYALYSPMDFLSWNLFFYSYPTTAPCNLFANMDFMRTYANTYGMDMTSNFFACDSFVNIDILYSNRATLNDSFLTWQLSGIARGAQWEGGPAPLFSETNPNVVDLFMFTGLGDIWMIQNTGLNPSGIGAATRLPAPINPDSNEFIADNAFLEHISPDSVILIYEKYTDPNFRDFMFTISTDTGLTWSTPQTITTITNSLGHIEHPCLYKDTLNQWWLYFSIDYNVIVRSQQAISGNWDSWSAPQTLFSKGNALSIGEPTVSRNGDISFSLAYQNPNSADTSDVYDLDPWILPAHSTTSVSESVSPGHVLIYPNPASGQLIISSAESEIKTIVIRNAIGQVVYSSQTFDRTATIDVSLFSNGIYFVQITDSSPQKITIARE